MPFLSLIILGLLAVLAFQIADYFQQKRMQALENKAAVKIVEGRAEMKIWGFDQWMAAIDGSLLKEGDMIRTFPGSRVILSLLNGSVVRLGSETELELTVLKTKDSQDNASFLLKNGEIWLQRSEKDTVRAEFKVTTDHLEIDSLGTVFDVGKDAKERVHVLEGKVRVAVKVEDSEDASGLRVADTFEIALGQEINVGQQEISDLSSRKPIFLLEVLSDDFREGDWYVWNRQQDSGNSAAMSVKEAVQQQKQPQVPGTATQAIETPPAAVEAVLAKPQIVSPAESERVVRAGPVVISGTTTSMTDKIEVTTYIAGKAEPYVLQRYVSGSERWTYVVSRDYGNLVPGVNRFTIAAIDKTGRRSESAEITITYDRPREAADLSAPAITSFSGNSLETFDDAVKVEGRVGKGIVRVFVNNLPLTRYVPDSGVWAYYARTTYGNLRSGENSYEVYGVDVDGKRTAVARFTIAKKTRPTENPISNQQTVGSSSLPAASSSASQVQPQTQPSEREPVL